jgi:hypothetical protein
MPGRPGKELAALNWLSEAGVEDADGLGDKYEAPDDELNENRGALGIAAGGDVRMGRRH